MKKYGKSYGDEPTKLMLSEKARKYYDMTSPIFIYEKETDNGLIYTIDDCGSITENCTEDEVNEILEQIYDEIFPDIDKIIADLVNYAANMQTEHLDKIKEEKDISEELADFLREWNDAECDEECTTPEQNARLDEILERYAKEIIEA